MKLTLLFFLIAFISSNGLASTQASWATTKSEEGNFSVSMPGTPRPLAAPIILGDLRAISHVFHVTSAGNNYSVSYTDLAIDPTDEAVTLKIFEAAKENLLKRAEARLITEKIVTLNANPGREITADAPNGIILSRTFLVKNRMYQLVVVYPEKSSLTDIKRFMDSFSLLDSQPTPITGNGAQGGPPKTTGGVTCGVAGKTILLPESVIRSQVLSMGNPSWSVDPKKADHSYKVEVAVLMDEKGNIVEAETSDGPVPLRDAAIRAAKNSKFKPSAQCGTPVKVKTTLTYYYAIAVPNS